MKYDYRKNITEDIKRELEDYATYTSQSIEDLSFDELFDYLWTCDNVTGNASGSYTFNTWEAAEHLLHNEDLLNEALEEFGGDYKRAIESPEYADVTIRCYLLNECLTRALEEEANK